VQLVPCAQAFLHSFKRARIEREDKHGGLDLGASCMCLNLSGVLNIWGSALLDSNDSSTDGTVQHLGVVQHCAFWMTLMC